jgi:hypothetical protein
VGRDRLECDGRSGRRGAALKKIPFTVQNRMLALLAPMHRDIIEK